jgi:hypothetical protein
MMKKFKFGKIIIASTIILIGFIACSKNNDEPQTVQKIYFEYYSINYAWSFSYTHWIIDDEGNVRRNRNTDSIMVVDENDMAKSIHYFDTVVYRIESSEFSKYVNMIQLAAKGTIDTVDQYLADYPETAYNCYWENKVVRLSLMNYEMQCTNKDSSAIKICDWLRSLQIRIYPIEKAKRQE